MIYFLYNPVYRTHTVCPAISWTELFWVGLYDWVTLQRLQLIVNDVCSFGAISVKSIRVATLVIKRAAPGLINDRQRTARQVRPLKLSCVDQGSLLYTCTYMYMYTYILKKMPGNVIGEKKHVLTDISQSHSGALNLQLHVHKMYKFYFVGVIFIASPPQQLLKLNRSHRFTQADWDKLIFCFNLSPFPPLLAEATWSVSSPIQTNPTVIHCFIVTPFTNKNSACIIAVLLYESF